MSNDVFTTIEAFGMTSLVEDGSNYWLYPNGGSPVELSYGGSPVVAGQFGAWAPIGAEATANGYEVAWKLTGADQYTIWYVDDGGNYLSSPIGTVSGSSTALESFEISFQQDLSGDGSIGVVPPSAPTVIEAMGSTSLAEAGSNYWLYPSSGAPVELNYGGSPVVAGQFGAWAPIGAEATANGYEVAWKLTGADQYTIWYVDDSGNYLSGPIGTVSGSSTALQSFETSFQQDLNGDGSIGVVPPSSPTVIEAFGSTSLAEAGSNYWLYPNGGSPVELSYAGATIVAGQFGAWAPIGAETTAKGYEVAWRLTGADQYTVWYFDNSGTYVSSAIGTVSGSSTALEAFETSFQQDLNGDGLIGFPPPPSLTVLEAFGSTSLTEAGSNYWLYPNDGSPVELSYAGAPIVAGQFDQYGAWAPIGAEATANGYEIAWKVAGADQFTVWYFDNSGNYLSSAIGTVSGSSTALEAFETSFQQDLNGDGLIGAPPPPAPTVIEAFGSTSLAKAGSNYWLYPIGGSPIELSYAGAPIVAGQFDQYGAWAPIGAEATANGYEIAWKVTGVDQYTVWYFDNSGNYLSSGIGTMSGSSTALEAFETSFQQDLNGDGVIGAPPPPPPTVIEAFGSTSLAEVGSNYWLYPNGGSPVELSYAGAPIVAGQYGAWAPIGAEATATGYEVAWKPTGADQYTVWYFDDSGNYLSSPIGTVSGSSTALESFEPSFQQDLNGDGSIGAGRPPSPTVIEAFGSTTLAEAGSNYWLYPNGGPPVELSYGGSPVVAGQFGAWAPIGAEATANGYEVALKLTGADQYTAWYVDNSGNYLSSPFETASGSSTELESLEPSFQQDLNGDGLIGVPQDLPQFVYQGVDSNGVQTYDVTWDALGFHPFAVRVLAPDNPSPDYPHSFLFALPAEAGLDPAGGSGLDELQQLGVQNQYNATIIEPIFPINSWYADNPTDPTIDYETFAATFLPQWVDSTLATTGDEKNLLIGFSKSGYGALDLLFKHPAVFEAAAAWDFPADMTSYEDWGASTDYGTEANFQDNYRLTGSFIDALKAPFTTENRIWFSGYSIFPTDVTDFDTLLTSEGVLHTLGTESVAGHAWDGGWLPNAVAGLYGLEQDLIGNAPTAGSSVSSSVATSSSGSAPLGAQPQQSAVMGLSDQLQNQG